MKYYFVSKKPKITTILGDERPPITDQSMPVFPSNPFPGRLNSPPYSAMDLGSYDSDDSWFEHRNTYDLNSKIMLTAIISLSFVVVLVIVLHIYARCVLRRQAGHHAIIRRLGLATVTSEPPKTGLDPVIIASLPIFSYKQTIINGDDDQEDNGQECAVCLSFLENEEMARLLPNCKHTFHAECIDKWLSSNSTCPICRTEAEPRLQPVAREGPVGSAGTAPPLEQMCIECACLEAGNGNQNNTNNKGSASSSSSMSRLSSFKRILSRERSSRRLQSEIQEQEDLERR